MPQELKGLYKTGGISFIISGVLFNKSGIPRNRITRSAVKQALCRMKSAIRFHLEGLKKEGADIAEPSTRVEFIEIAI